MSTKPEPLKGDGLPEEELQNHKKGMVYFVDDEKPIFGTLSIERSKLCITISRRGGLSVYPMSKIRKITWH